ncbi:hypothetical protein ABNB59_21955 [Paenibacillus larvae]|uniref:Uncharacterized protein n=6 Tax=root TaxID=1 RepID=A0A0K2CZI5_9CAUD|nr:hypothetical protein [Paenibacillus larvae]YP_009196125.1 hypothetical protein VEGAS_26 [Paenibacillus phage Vegas]ALA12761.1 hypothetical protein HAYLEY_26 [Paenibacillus phage Hayley]ALA12846.1 hypothetical protein VADIM_26 [Paenibacillus phage Vadim]ALA12932.1 hypothetical protein DIANE_26 [Paenibacillus phage Diane]UYE92050.1 hypothetical protein LUNBUN_26 [Paenibacillus phage LunBun]UYE92132.1 hypothetical protein BARRYFOSTERBENICIO_26 [Paenibacillus phage BarryFoster_Benicio]UYL9149
MTTAYKADQSRGKSALQIAEILNNCELLLRLEIEDLGSKIVLHIITDSATVQYVEVTRDGMLSFLRKLREYVIRKGDIDELLEEVQYLEE